MRLLRKRWCDGVCGVAMAAALAGVCGASTRTRHVDPWTAAVQARAAFEAEPRGTHTRAEYARVMDGFRAIYHEIPRMFTRRAPWSRWRSCSRSREQSCMTARP